MSRNRAAPAARGRRGRVAVHGLVPRDSVVDVTALVTLDETDLADWAGDLPPGLMHDVDHGLRRVLAL